MPVATKIIAREKIHEFKLIAEPILLLMQTAYAQTSMYDVSPEHWLIAK